MLATSVPSCAQPKTPYDPLYLEPQIKHVEPLSRRNILKNCKTRPIGKHEVNFHKFKCTPKFYHSEVSIDLDAPWEVRLPETATPMFLISFRIVFLYPIIAFDTRIIRWHLDVRTCMIYRCVGIRRGGRRDGDSGVGEGGQSSDNERQYEDTRSDVDRASLTGRVYDGKQRDIRIERCRDEASMPGKESRTNPRPRRIRDDAC